MKHDSAVKTWEKTKLQNLVRHKSGRYYARLFLNGKEIWKSLKTDHFSVATARLVDAQKEHRERKSRGASSSSAKMTFGQATALHFQHLAENVNIKRRTRQYWREVFVALEKSWPGLNALEVRRLTPAACREWASKFVLTPGHSGKTISSTRYNATIALVRHILDVSIESGVIYSNPASILVRKSVPSKQLTLPTRAQFAAFIGEMRAGHSRDSKNCADLAEGLAFTGCRLAESTQIEWRDLDFEAGETLVKGDPEERTKNSEIRRVPMIPQARELFKRMRADRSDEPANAKVFLVNECQKSMDRAAKKIGMARITHHDLRHFFATVCIESGVDIPTVSRWLGHKDGGALAMRTYGHLRREHSIAQAQKVSFVPIAPTTPKVAA